MTISLKRGYQLLVSIFCVLWIGKQIVVPLTTYFIYADQYKKLTAECGLAMDNSWYLRQELEIDPRSEAVEMLVCHEYDKLRKIMLIAGLSENVLAYLGLDALELDQKPISEYVDRHRFRER